MLARGYGILIIMKILVVEDSVIAQKIIQVVLINLGHQVSVANNGTEAVKKFQGDSYDFVFMDIGLPDFDGDEATRRIRVLEEKTQTHVPIVALTAHVGDKYEKRALDSGMDDFLNKPLTADKAQIVISKHTTNHD